MQLSNSRDIKRTATTNAINSHNDSITITNDSSNSSPNKNSRNNKENKVKFSRVCVVYSASVAVHLQPVVDLSDDHQLALGRRESQSRRAGFYLAFEHLRFYRLWNERQMFRCPDK